MLQLGKALVATRTISPFWRSIRSYEIDSNSRAAQAFFPTATPRLKPHPSMRQNCSALTLASLSGEGSGEGRRGELSQQLVCEARPTDRPHPIPSSGYPIK